MDKELKKGGICPECRKGIIECMLKPFGQSNELQCKECKKIWIITSVGYKEKIKL